ncbi:hypothetical protein ACFVTY_15485 [Streptomyces sp. NPDC058067]|uniref:hypothetical protein n=1 Tax=Streptomyces sp. NPDC058067 TaxID=3346324 RepID=UPI0036E603FB
MGERNMGDQGVGEQSTGDQGTGDRSAGDPLRDDPSRDGVSLGKPDSSAPWPPPAETTAPLSQGETLLDVPGPSVQGEDPADTPVPPVQDQAPAGTQAPHTAGTQAAPAQGEAPANPFAPPSPPAEQYNPFAPPSPATTGTPGPWSPQPQQWQAPGQGQAPSPGAPYGWVPQANPFAPPGEPVPPPPVSPDGPGQLDHGYPAAPYGYGRHAATGPGGMPYGGPGYGWPGMPVAARNGMGVAALTLGIISAVGFVLWPIAIVVGILAIIFGGIGRARATKGGATNGGQALAGLICGIGGLILAVLMMAFVISQASSSGNSNSHDDSGYSAAA